MNKQDRFKTKFNNLFGEIEVIKHEEEIEEDTKVASEETIKPVEKEVIKEVEQKTEETLEIKEEKIITEDTKVASEETKSTPNRLKRNYYIPVDMLEDMKKVVYMDRELGGNYTELVLTALRQYLDTKKDLIKEYDKLKASK